MRVKILFDGSSGHDQSGVRLKETTINNKKSVALRHRQTHYFELIYLTFGKKTFHCIKITKKLNKFIVANSNVRSVFDKINVFKQFRYYDRIYRLTFYCTFRNGLYLSINAKILKRKKT